MTESSQNPSSTPERIKLASHKDHVFQHMNEFRLQNLFCDVNLNINGKIFTCHRVVLATTSPYFKTMFNGNFVESKSDTITINDIETEIFEEILNALYTGGIRLVSSNVYFILKASHLLQLEEVESTCVSYIMANPKIKYLVDACIFAQNIGQTNLHCKCAQTISEDLSTYGRTESFKHLQIDTLKSILQNCGSTCNEREAVFSSISQWCEHNKANYNDVRMLFELVATRITDTLNLVGLMTHLTFKTYDSKMNENFRAVKESESRFNFDLTLYLNTVDVKSGEKGWSAFKTSDELDDYVFSSHHATDSAYTKVFKFGSKTFCIERIGEKNVFSCYNEDNSKINLKPPPFIHKNSDIMVITNNNSISLAEKKCRISRCHSINTYDCTNNLWKRTLYESDILYFTALTSLNNTMYYTYTVHSNCVDKISYLFSYDIRSKQKVKLATITDCEDYDNVAICGFDKNIFLSGSYYNDKGVLQNSFNIFDTTMNRWLSDVKPMNIDRANHNIFHHNGFIYVVENSLLFATNERYDLKSNTWIVLPPLPKQFIVEYEDNITTLSPGTVIGYSV